MAVASVGDTARSTLTITESDVEAYASLVGDENPIHLDDEYAEATMFDGRIAHGLLAGGVVSAALADLPGDVIYVSQDFEFLAPVRPGDAVEATVTVAEALGDGQFRVTTEVVSGETTVLTGEAVVLSLPHEECRTAEEESECPDEATTATD